MADNSQKFDTLHERNKQTLNNISQLQSQEKQLYDRLNNVSLSSERKQQIINSINEIYQMRINMYANMKDMYSYYQQNVAESRTTLGQEIAAIDVLENELNETKRRMNIIQDETYNKLRLVEINTYYGKRYNAHATLMKIIVLTCIPLLILSILANKGILPSNIYVFLTGIILIIGMIVLGLELIDISNRDNMNWDEYNWNFDASKAPSSTGTSSTGTSSTGSNPWETPSVVCVGSACCADGITYNAEQNMCVPNSTNVETFNVLEKYAYTQ